MNDVQIGTILFLLAASILILVVPAVVSLILRLVKRQSKKTCKRAGFRHKVDFLFRLFLAVLCLRLAVGLFGVITEPQETPDGAIAEEQETLTGWEEAFNSFTHALQTFSMDEDYTEYITKGKEMIGRVFEEVGEPLLGLTDVVKTGYGLYVSFLNVLAPVLGGALIFALLTNIFPWLHLRWSYLLSWRPKYYFSELNEMSLALAQSLSEGKRFSPRKPYMIFTDTYLDDESEKSSELVLEAKWMGAICVRDDLAHIEKCRRGKKTFFLVDENGASNLRALNDLANSENYIYLKKSEIHLFTTDDAYVQIERSVREKLRGKLNDDEMPIITPVHCYRNLILNLLRKIPLYDPLVGRAGKRSLTVTILGTGFIGTEMFLTTYWMGQMLDCELKINVLSQETEDEFWSKIDYVNPEIRSTTEDGHPILTKNRKGEKAPAYCRVEYIPCNVKSSTFVKCLTDGERDIRDTDYFLVSLGTDEDNISVANTVRKYVGERHIFAQDGQRTVIAYVVYNSELSDTLNTNRYFCYASKEPDVYMCAIGSLREIYHVNNVLMESYHPLAETVHAAYLSAQGAEVRRAHYAKWKQDHYKTHSSLGRAVHIPYKMFSLGLIRTSVFDRAVSDEERERHLKELYRTTYRKFALGEERLPCATKTREHVALLHRLAWLEHRRWNAWTRVYGFRSTRDYPTYAQVTDSYKQMDILLHPCLVECDEKGIRAAMNPRGEIDPDTVLQKRDETGDYDLLDDLSYELYECGYNGYDFKLYDYPRYDFT